MRISEFFRKSAVVIAFLLAVVTLGLATYIHLHPKKVMALSVNNPGEVQPSTFERYRMPLRSAAYVMKYRELISLLATQVKLSATAHDAGKLPLGKLLADRRDLALAQVGLLKLGGKHRSLGSGEAIMKLRFAEELERHNKQLYLSGKLDLPAYTKTQIELTEMELEILKSPRLFLHNQAHAKHTAKITPNTERHHF
ncbi:MAG: hypothetical protein LBM70_05150 [Victivallales bacterium]|jgi:hypothetical protein|nr:hypothetical protein [Victivallales bacterium]